MRNVTKCSLDARLKQWIHCLSRDSSKAIPALDLYCGDSWANILKGIESPRLKVCCNLWIASAGYGLVSSSDNLVCYSATFTSGSEDSVLAGDCPKFNSLDWWTAICKCDRPGVKARLSIEALARQHPSAPMIVALSSDYLKAVQEDLACALDSLNSPDQLLIISAGAQKNNALAATMLPCDARLEHMLGGSRSSLNARALRHILKTLDATKFSSTRIQKKFGSLLEKQPPARTFNRKKLTDREIRACIKKLVHSDATITHSAALRSLRDQGMACEQKRFRTIFKSIQRNEKKF